MENDSESADLRGISASLPLRFQDEARHAEGMTDSLKAVAHQAKPMYLTDEEVREFQGLVQESTGTWLDHDTAARRASQLLYLIRVLIERTPEESTPTCSKVVQLDESPPQF